MLLKRSTESSCSAPPTAIAGGIRLVRVVAFLIVALLLVPLVPVMAAEDPTEGRCEGLGVPAPVEIGKVCAFSGLGTNAACPPNASSHIDATCTSTLSWSWLADSSLGLPGRVTVKIHRVVTSCVDLIGAPPTCTDHVNDTTETCAWDFGGACRGGDRIDQSWGPQPLELGEEFKVLSHIDITMDATATVGGVDVGSIHWGDFSDAGAAVDVVDNGR